MRDGLHIKLTLFKIFSIKIRKTCKNKSAVIALHLIRYKQLNIIDNKYPEWFQKPTAIKLGLVFLLRVRVFYLVSLELTLDFLYTYIL